jgi:hypothetical protein
VRGPLPERVNNADWFWGDRQPFNNNRSASQRLCNGIGHQRAVIPNAGMKRRSSSVKHLLMLGLLLLVFAVWIILYSYFPASI